MSADNGVYILETDGEFRVKEMSAIENLWWSRCSVHGSDIHFGNDGRESCRECRSTNAINCTPEMALENAREVYAETVPFTDRGHALEFAAEILESLEICEYGISIIKMRGKF